ncbi:MAG: serine/threonine protein kinase psk1 [Chrysothrix sp. TS-e1954]|nr:MAG: serine/threonine protein kinase psk1 [Chrysothrix sp. TS-e1954]
MAMTPTLTVTEDARPQQTGELEANGSGLGISDAYANDYSTTDHSTKVEVAPETAIAHLSSRAKKKRKRAKGMKPGAPATNVTIGFNTPGSSGGEDSDISSRSTPRLSSLRPPSAVNSSPATRTSSLTTAISAMRLQVAEQSDTSEERMPRSSNRDSADRKADFTSPLAQVSSESNSSITGSETLEMPLQRDFAAAETKPKRFHGAVEGGLRYDSPHRKMTANDFEPLKCLGKGTFGTVLLVKQHSTGRLFAQKQLKKASLTVHKRLVEQTKSERAILESVNRHPFVVKLYYAFQDHKKLYLILEYAQGGELFHHLELERMFSEEVAAFYMAEMVLALDYLHSNLGVVYRDLKPENCLLDLEGHLLLTDFGLSKVAVNDTESSDGESACNSVLGTVDYMAPEVVQGKPYDSAVDWWSLGALGFDLLTGAPPFSGANHAKIQHKIVHGKPAMPYYLSPDSKDFLTRLLRKEPKKRLGGNMSKDLATIKAHRFFRRIDWRALQKREVVAPIQPIITDPAEAENFSSDFTGLAMSPVEAKGGFLKHERMASIDDPFRGFSFVAGKSLLEAGILG